MTPESRTYIAKDGRELTFLFNHRGLIAAEKSADAGLGKLLAGLAEGRIGFIAGLIHGGLSVHQPEITQADAFDLWESDGERVVKAMAEALKAAMPLVENILGVKPNPPKPRRRGTGSPSSRPGSKTG